MVTYKAGLRFHFIESCHHDHVEHCQWVRLGSWKCICLFVTIQYLLFRNLPADNSGKNWYTTLFLNWRFAAFSSIWNKWLYEAAVLSPVLCDLNDPPDVGGAVHIRAQLLRDRVHTLQHLQQDISHHTLKLILGVEFLYFDKIDLKSIFLRSFKALSTSQVGAFLKFCGFMLSSYYLSWVGDVENIHFQKWHYGRSQPGR